MNHFRTLPSPWAFWLILLGAGLFARPSAADEKPGMPDLCQIEETCLPTSTANLMIWFGQHGYPKLISTQGDTEDERELHTVHRIMEDTDARFDWGTRQDAVTIGIQKYIHDAGYDCDVEYRGMDYGKPGEKAPLAFSQDWLKNNDDPNKGFILLLTYCKYDDNSNTFTNAWNAGHAVTLVNAESNMILIHDPAHYPDETGRKILSPQTLTGGRWISRGINVPVDGMLLLSGSLLEAPPDAGVMLTGAVCVTMRPIPPPGIVPVPDTAAGPSATLAGKGPGAPATAPSAPAKPVSASTSWAMWIFHLLFNN